MAYTIHNFQMTKDNKIRMPSGMGGLTRYFDDYKSKIQISPGHVILITVVVVLIIVALHVFGGTV